MTSLLSILMLTSTSATAVDYKAKDHLPVLRAAPDKFLEQYGAVALSGTTEAALLVDPSDPTAFGVIPDFADVEYDDVFRITLEDSVTVTEAYAGALGLKVRKRNVGRAGVQEVVELPTFTVGDATFEDVQAVIGPVNSLGLATFPDLAFAIEHSPAHTLVLAPATAGSELVSRVGGQQLSYADQGVQTYKKGKSRGFSENNRFRLSGTFNGQEATVVLLTTLHEGAVATRDLLDGMEAISGISVSRWFVADLQTEGVSFDALMVGETYAHELSGRTQQVRLNLYDMEVAVDPVAQVLTLNQVDSETPMPTDEARQLQELEEGLVDADGNALEGDAAVGAWTGLAWHHLGWGNLDEALGYAQKVAETAPDSCDNQSLLGTVYGVQGEWDKAAAAFEAGAVLYEDWASLPLEQRDELAEAAAEDPTLVLQNHGCADLRGRQAEAMLAQGMLDEAIALYDKHYDIDPTLARAAASAFLAQERYERADAATRQVQLRESSTSSDSALLLAVTAHAMGKGDEALANYESALPDSGPMVYRAYGEAVVAIEGTAGLARVEPYTHTSTANLNVAAAAAYEAAGQDATAYWEAAAAGYARQLALVEQPGAEAGLALSLARLGKLDEAKAHAEKAIADEPYAADGYLVLGDVAAERANWDEARAWYLKAATMDPTHPLAAGLLSEL